VTQSRHDLVQHLREQHDFLEDSAKAYDNGRKAEAKRLATTIRSMVHDTAQSTSLLTLMGEKSRLRFSDSIPPSLLALAQECVGKPATLTGPGGLATILMDGRSTRYEPMLKLGPPAAPYPQIPFDDWWKPIVMVDFEGNGASRKNLLMWLANKDGGAHVDKLPSTYEALSRNGSMGLTFSDPSGSTSTASPVPAAVRQIAHELLDTLARQLSHYRA
jgi:hypothetical protein